VAISFSLSQRIKKLKYVLSFATLILMKLLWTTTVINLIVSLYLSQHLLLITYLYELQFVVFLCCRYYVDRGWTQYYHKLSEGYLEDVTENRTMYCKNKSLCKILKENRMALAEKWSVTAKKKSTPKKVNCTPDSITDGDRFSYDSCAY
jgi:hypothetical protein